MKHLDLEIKEQSFDKASKTISTSLKQSDFQAFEKLHNKTFLEKYYNDDAKKIEKDLTMRMS